MPFKLDRISQRNLKGVHPTLVSVVRHAAAISNMEFRVIEGMRTKERQRLLVSRGASKTMNSRHLTGHAVDIVPLDNGKVSWAWPLYFKLAPIIKRAAQEREVALEWGGDWESFKDGPHWQLPFKQFPPNAAPPTLVAGSEVDRPARHRETARG